MKENRQISQWVNKCGGNLRLNMTDQVNIVIVEMSKLRGMIQSLMKWKERAEVAYSQTTLEQIVYQSESENVELTANLGRRQ